MAPYGKSHGALALLLLLGCQAAAAEEYWGYTYKGFDVTTTEKGYAAPLARNLVRFDAALSQILEVPEHRLPVHFYALPDAQMKALIGTYSAAAYRFNGYDVSVVFNPNFDRANHYWGALFGYSGSVLAGRRYPPWMLYGLPVLFAQAQFGATEVKTGGVNPAMAHILATRTLVPMRTFLALQAKDPQFKESQFQDLYEAESWYLTSEIYVEGMLRPEFKHYFALLRDGKSEADAFAASFKISYEELDKLLAAAMHNPAHRFAIKVPLEPEGDDEPTKLSAAEAQGRLAALRLEFGHHREDAAPLAAEALQADPRNETALRTAALANAADGNLAAALTAADRIAALPAPSAAALADAGSALARLAQDATRNPQAAGPLDAGLLSRKAGAAYERALRTDSGCLPAWAGLADLYGSQHEATAARELVTRVRPVLQQHPNNGTLARSLAQMCARTGQRPEASEFGEQWREEATSRTDQEQAEALIAWLKGTPATATP